jgi:hypothetical protein
LPDLGEDKGEPTGEGMANIVILATKAAEEQGSSASEEVSTIGTTATSANELRLMEECKKLREMYQRTEEEKKKLEAWKTAKEENPTRVSEKTDTEEFHRARSFAAKSLFHTVKFVTNEKEELNGWKKPGSIGYKMVRGCGIEPRLADEWWPLYKSTVTKGLSDARNIASVGTKHAMKCKLKASAGIGGERETEPLLTSLLLFAGAKKDMDNTPVPSLQEILKMRQDPEGNAKANEAYVFFVDNILGCVVGRQKTWTTSTKCFRTISSEVTVSDEAFALLVLFNNWAVVFDNKKTAPIYTRKEAGMTNKRNSGWSAAGITKFNELVEMVKSNRNATYAKAAEEDIMRKIR